MTANALTPEVVIIGAGVIGLAIARELALSGHETIILEAESAIGTVTSSRNSEVIHAGIYYPPNSLKAKTCVEGKQLLYQYCDQKNIEYRRCGKLIVAVHPQQNPALKALQSRARDNQVLDIEYLNQAEITSLEPEVTGAAALYSPSTGIINSHQFMQSLCGDFEAAGGWIVLNSPVISGAVRDSGVSLKIGGRDPCEVEPRIVINSAGLNAVSLLHKISGFPVSHIPQQYFAKGDYFSILGQTNFRHLIYPMPEPGGLGIHLTLDLAGQARLGPDVEWVQRPFYGVTPDKETQFKQAAAEYWPGIRKRRLSPDYAGIRSKLVPQGAPHQDFVISTPSYHCVPGWYNLLGIESPGLTASLAIAKSISSLIGA